MRETPAISAMNVADIFTGDFYRELFAPQLELVPQLNELYELELAFYESRILNQDELVRNSAYFAQVGDTLTRHFLMCSGRPVRLPVYSSSRLKSFFKANQFRTGYATHGLFPYRGKFHPQMIKGLINIMGLKPCDTVLDPMMGSGTVLVEAAIMGIKSVGIDASPFCQFMAQRKIDGLTLPTEPIRDALKNSERVFQFFQSLVGQPDEGRKARSVIPSDDQCFLMESSGNYKLSRQAGVEFPISCNDVSVENFLLLAYLDSAGYSERSTRNTPYNQFRAVLERYLFVVEKIQDVIRGIEPELAGAKALVGDARSIPLDSSSIDGILFSPPYSFAIDYLDNDAFHLGFLGVDINKLRSNMVGLRGRALPEKYELYISDMRLILKECARVLRVGRICTIVIGTNNNQLSKVFGVSPEKVKGLDEVLVELGSDCNLKLIHKINRQIVGMANTMRNESILMLQRM